MLDVAAVLLGDGRMVDPNVGQINVALAFQYSAVDAATVHYPLFFAQDLKIDQIIVDGDFVTHGDAGNQVFVVNANGTRLNIGFPPGNNGDDILVRSLLKSLVQISDPWVSTNTAT